MDFKTYKINNKPEPQEPSPKTAPITSKLPKFSQKISPKKLGINLIVLGLTIGIIALVFGIYKIVKQIDYSVLLKAAGTQLLVDENGHTNFLIMGIGGKNHDGGDLTDTIMIASMDQKDKRVSMVSVPRDIYVTDTEVGSSKINEVYFYAKKHFENDKLGLEFFKSKVEELTNIKIQYYILVDFKGFKEIVDTIGGIDINVAEKIHDPYYPKDGTYLYETFSIEPGLHHMDGEIALKYSRSRKTTSDFDRASRQQQVIYAIKEKALTTDIIFSSEKISEILTSLKANLVTNISVGEILTLGGLSKDYNESSITHNLLHDDPNLCGGFLYTPAREDYNGAFVLLSAGGDSYIHRYFSLLFSYPTIDLNNTKIHILNGTKTPGIAGETKQILTRLCFNVNRYGNATTLGLPETTYFYKQKIDENGKEIDSRPNALDFLQTIIPGKETTIIPAEYSQYLTETDILIEIGDDYATSEEYIEDPFYYMVQLTPTTTTTVESNTTPN